jgi:sugar-specific transcriptional regulator TrmB
MTSGKVVRYDKGDPHGSPYYVVDVGEAASIKVPVHKIKEDTVLSIDRYLEEKKAVEKDKGDFETPDDLSPEDQEDLMDMMLDLIFDLDDKQITDKQAGIINDIVDILDDDEDNDSVDEVFKIRKRRDLQLKRKRRRAYRRKRSTRKIRAKRYRRSAKGKLTARKAKRKGKFGRTSTGKRQRRFIGPDLKR